MHARAAGRESEHRPTADSYFSCADPFPLFRACVCASQRTSGGTGDELQSRPDGRDDRGGASDDDGPGALAAAALSLSTSPRRLASWLSFRWWRCCAIGMLLLLLLPLVLLLFAASACERVLELAAAVAVASVGRAWLLRVWTAPLSLWLSLAASAWKAAMRSRRDMDEEGWGVMEWVHASFGRSRSAQFDSTRRAT